MPTVQLVLHNAEPVETRTARCRHAYTCESKRAGTWSTKEKEWPRQWYWQRTWNKINVVQSPTKPTRHQSCRTSRDATWLQPGTIRMMVGRSRG